MRRAYAAEAVRRIEQATIDVTGADVLMQRAAAGVATAAATMLEQRRGGVYGARVMVLVGPGNNGGDALYAGRRLAARGAQVTAVACLGTPHASGLAAFLAAGGRVRTPEQSGLTALDPPAHAPADLARADLVIDGILGIGGRAGLTGVAELAAAAVRRSAVPVLAVDLPSGIATDTGAVPDSALRADVTVTFGEFKPCHLIEPGRAACGSVHLVDIGLDPTLHDEPAAVQSFDEDDLAQAWPYPDPTGDKYARGVVGVETGSEQYPGAAVLSAYGSVFGGAGMVRFLGPPNAADILLGDLPNVVYTDGRVQARLFGSGWGERPDGTQVLAAAAEEGLPAVVDADALKHLPAEVPPIWLLTPHAGELAALLGTQRSWVTEDPLRAVRAAAERTGASVLLKGATQLVARPGRRTVDLALPGPAWTGQAGSGDVLGGVCAALLAAGCPAHMAGVLGASVQAYAARRRPGAVPPHELARDIGHCLGVLQRRSDDLAKQHGRRHARPVHQQQSTR